MSMLGSPVDWNPTDAARLARAAAVRTQGEFKVLERWRLAIDGATAESPRLVQRLDQPDGFYYIVDFLTAATITARVAIDAVSGKLLRASGVGTADAGLRPFVDPAPFIQSRAGTSLGTRTAARVIRPGTVGVHPVLVWRWSAASRSLLLPFHLLTVGDRVYYLRVDGTLYPELAKGRPGT